LFSFILLELNYYDNNIINSAKKSKYRNKTEFILTERQLESILDRLENINVKNINGWL
jgi:hypothetical protein